MKRNRAALVTSVSTAMLGAGWVAGVVGTAVAAQGTPLTAKDPAAAAPAPARAGPSGTFTSAQVQTRFGIYQVALTVEAGTITSVAMVQSGASDGTSQQITAGALPTLQQRVLSAQTYAVQGISGASFTTQGNTAAVQNAMAQAGM